ncbi:MAG: 50S ribosomal protein L18e, partial [Candidatus Micrarchaeia archaeon]
MKRMKTDEGIAGLIIRLEKLSKAQKAPFWAAVARHLSKPHRSMAEVDVAKLASLVPTGTIALVPGKVI